MTAFFPIEVRQISTALALIGAREERVLSGELLHAASTIEGT